MAEWELPPPPTHKHHIHNHPPYLTLALMPIMFSITGEVIEKYVEVKSCGNKAVMELDAVYTLADVWLLLCLLLFFKQKNTAFVACGCI